tara:strand:+ start:117 stop:845 length:729 start_codon:yes stop_codon:yes gene_type:complete
MEEYVDINKLSVKQINKDVAKKVIIKHHYTHAASQCRYAFGIYKESEHSFFDSHDELVGVATYGYPVGRLAAQSISENLEPNEVLELTRLFIFDDHGKNIESYFIGQTMRLLKEIDNSIKCLMSYADPKVGHLGGIYQATNWLYQGDSMRMVDTYSIKIEEDGSWMHSRTVFSRWGSNNLDILKKKIGKTFWIRLEPRKHRYIYFLGNKKNKKKLIGSLKHPVLNYPKEFDKLNLEVERIDV